MAKLKKCRTCHTATAHKTLSRCVPCAERHREFQRDYDDCVKRRYGAKSYKAAEEATCT